MFKCIYNFVLLIKNYWVCFKLLDVFKLGIYILFFVVLFIIFFGFILVKMFCSIEVVEEKGILVFSFGLIDVMYEVISINMFDFDEFYILIIKKYFCMGVGKFNIGFESFFEVFNNVLDFDLILKEGDK